MAESNTAAGIVVATNTTIVRGRGDSRTIVRQGEAWDANDPFVIAHPDLFSADSGRARRGAEDGVVEEKTARPGRKAQVKPRD